MISNGKPILVVALQDLKDPTRILYLFYLGEENVNYFVQVGTNTAGVREFRLWSNGLSELLISEDGLVLLPEKSESTFRIPELMHVIGGITAAPQEKSVTDQIACLAKQLGISINPTNLKTLFTSLDCTAINTMLLIETALNCLGLASVGVCDVTSPIGCILGIAEFAACDILNCQSLPIATTNAATSITSNSATLNATVNPYGLSTIAYFQWGTSTSYGNNTTLQELGSGSSSLSVSANLSALSPSTTYYYQIVAADNAKMTTYGSSMSFTTLASGAPPGATYTLTVKESITGGGTVTSSPAGISCGSVCSENLTGGTTVTLTAAPTTSFNFTGWQGCDTTGEYTCTVTMTQNQTVTAYFTLCGYSVPCTITIVVDMPSGIGTVTSSPPGINCDASCQANFSNATAVVLTFSPSVSNSGITYTWNGCDSTSGYTCTIAMGYSGGTLIVGILENGF
jgi:hypothetical protein